VLPLTSETTTMVVAGVADGRHDGASRQAETTTSRRRDQD
jgi:hypothetical protein